MRGGMPSSRETLVFGVGASPRLRTPPTTICSLGVKCCQICPSWALGTSELSPIPCSSIAQGELGVASFNLIKGIRIFVDAGCCPWKRNSNGSDSPAQVPLLWCLPFSRGAGHSLSPRARQHSCVLPGFAWIMDHCNVDPHGSTVFPASHPSPGTPGPTGDTFAPKCSQLGMEEWEVGKDDPQEGIG